MQAPPPPSSSAQVWPLPQSRFVAQLRRQIASSKELPMHRSSAAHTTSPQLSPSAAGSGPLWPPPSQEPLAGRQAPPPPCSAAHW